MRLWVRSVALLSGLRIWCCHKLWCRSQMCSDLVWLWLWCRQAATALIGPLAWKPPYAAGTALKRQKKNFQKLPGPPQRLPNSPGCPLADPAPATWTCSQFPEALPSLDFAQATPLCLGQAASLLGPVNCVCLKRY